MRRPARVPRPGYRLRQALSPIRLRQLLDRIPALRIAVVGDFFLDAYYDIDPRLRERSLETGRTAHQVVQTRRQAGAAGTVVANLAALGCGHIETVGFHGDDGEGYELRRALDRLGADTQHLLVTDQRVTPTYGKPCLVTETSRTGPGRSPGRRRSWQVCEELARLDIRNRNATPPPLQARWIAYLRHGLGETDAVILMDQVEEMNCGVLTTRVRQAAEQAARRRPRTVFLADSRRRIGLFRQVSIKPNLTEASQAVGRPPPRGIAAAAAILHQLRGRRHRPCFCTLSRRGMLVAQEEIDHVAAFPVDGPTDPVGAGDTATATLACALAAGATATEAAVMANLAASVTVQQTGTTGTATPAQVRRRFREVDV